MAENTQQMAGNTQQMAGNMQQMAENTQQMAGNTQQMAGNTQQMAGNTHIMIDTVSEKLIDVINNLYKPEKIAIFVSDDVEYIERNEYERLYPKYKDLITLYEGNVCLNIRAYMAKNTDKTLTTIEYNDDLF